MSRFDGRSVIVTGGAKGIGGAICTAFAEEGARVVCADVDTVAGEALAAGAPSAGEIRFQRADVSKAAECDALVAATVEACGGVDILCMWASSLQTVIYRSTRSATRHGTGS